ncbi:hypothetical protein CSUB01_03147 [Colletotrichum sublineola]|uniref:Uncharacterized protein n=1 Tax=Colletotrichum sublineola TaxID=1173701 RepID=A0A066XHW5_COLSU|nr:hypothetical protein CSUB01_03147 [Colletotrichum sublineola]
MPPITRSHMGNETPPNNLEDVDMTPVSAQPSQLQKISGENGEEHETEISFDMNSSKVQFSQEHQLLHDLPSELCDQGLQSLDTAMDMEAFDSTPETQASELDVIDASSHYQKNRTQDDTQFLQYDTATRRLVDQVVQLQTQLGEYESEILKLRHRNARVENMTKDSQCQLAVEKKLHLRRASEREAYIDRLHGKIHRLKVKIASNQAVNSQDKAIANSRKVSDDAIKASWKTMTYNIESLVASVLTGCPSEQDLNHHEHKDKDESCAVCQIDARQISLLQNDDMREYMVQKLVWDAITRRILPHDGGRFGKSWAGAPGQLLSALFNELVEVPEITKNAVMLLRWKAESAAMIDKALGVDNIELKYAVDEEHLGLCSFIPIDCPDITAARHSLYQGLQKIFKEAIEIYRILMQSRAHFYLDPVKTQEVVTYNPEFHEAEAYDKRLSEQSIVLLGISPSLVKIGNADGGNYNKSNRLVKASVICD